MKITHLNTEIQELAIFFLKWIYIIIISLGLGIINFINKITPQTYSELKVNILRKTNNLDMIEIFNLILYWNINFLHFWSDATFYWNLLILSTIRYYKVISLIFKFFKINISILNLLERFLIIIFAFLYKNQIQFRN